MKRKRCVLLFTGLALLGLAAGCASSPAAGRRDRAPLVSLELGHSCPVLSTAGRVADGRGRRMPMKGNHSFSWKLYE